MCLCDFGSAVVVAAPWTDAGIGTYLHVDVAAVTTMSSAEVANPSDFFKQHAGVGASPHSDKSEGTDWLVVRQRMMNNALHEFLVQHGWRKEEAPRFGAGRDQAIVFARERRRQATGASNLETGMDCLFHFEFECATAELTYFLVKHSVSAAKVMHRTVGNHEVTTWLTVAACCLRRCALRDSNAQRLSWALSGPSCWLAIEGRR